jgi:hypothetical protein
MRCCFAQSVRETMKRITAEADKLVEQAQNQTAKTTSMALSEELMQSGWKKRGGRSGSTDLESLAGTYAVRP